MKTRLLQELAANDVLSLLRLRSVGRSFANLRLTEQANSV
jgi:hypothetical protein